MMDKLEITPDYVKDDPYLQGYWDGYNDGLSAKAHNDVGVGLLILLVVGVAGYVIGSMV